MMKRTVLATLAVMCLSAATCWALTVSVPFHFPGVDSGGNLSDALGTNGNVKANVNTTNGHFTASGKSKVQNLSRKAHSYINTPVNIPNVTVQASHYSVNKAGKANLTASGVAAGT